MTRLNAFLRLSRADQRLLLVAGFWVVMVRLGLTFLPFQTLRHLLARIRRQVRSSWQSPERIAWAVVATSRHVPRATCLTQALAAQVLLERQGYSTQLQIGVNRGQTKSLEAHAWLECQGKIVIGGELAGEFIPLPTLESEAR